MRHALLQRSQNHDITEPEMNKTTTGRAATASAVASIATTLAPTAVLALILATALFSL
jgi:hypothetical protein